VVWKFFKKNKNLLNIKADIRTFDYNKLNQKIDYVIHLASIANDPMSELDKNLSWEISLLGSKKLIEFSIKKKIKKFIYASSGSVYGIKKEKEVIEDLNLVPISLYNKVKMVTERMLLSYKDKIKIYIIRPATVCGYSPRMRYDLTVNALTISALKKKTITVYGGSQVRPNIHIDDITDLYLLITKKKIKPGIYNAGFENLKVKKIAEIVQKKIKSKIIIKKNSNDPRSYRLSSKKLLNQKVYKPQKNVQTAINELKKKFDEKKLLNDPKFYSIKWLKKII
jgi:nucleoside-diphosphate-sugar epimerase